MVKDVVQTSKVDAGFWYSFDYKPQSTYVGIDYNPLIFAFGDSERIENGFVGVNLHLFKSPSDRFNFVKNLQQKYHFMDEDICCALSPTSVNRLLPGAAAFIRDYKKVRANNIVRVKNAAVPLYINSVGNILIEKPQQQFVDALIAAKLYERNGEVDVGNTKTAKL